MWTGGFYYLLNLVQALQRHAHHQVTPIVFLPYDANSEVIDAFQSIHGLDVVKSEVFATKNDRARLLSAVVAGCDRAALRCFQSKSIDVVFEGATFYGWRFPLPSIAWLADFQHRRMRELFTSVAYWKRELGFRAQILSGRRIMVSSDDSRSDCVSFYPGTNRRITTVRFAVPIDSALLATSPSSITEQYRLPNRFFFLPNQFWKHKNHTLVVEALSILKNRGLEVVVACSGQGTDPRYPNFFTELNDLVVTRGLSENFRFLGMIPRNHLVALMRGCTALLNPSLFEGWSTTVEEAKSLGVPMLLSDIDVHREQVGDSAVYFDQNSAVDLADQLESFPNNPEAFRRAVEANAISNCEERVRRFALEFAALVGSVDV